MSCVWCCRKTATARWLQTILLLFFFNLYLHIGGWQNPTHAYRIFDYSQRTCPAQLILVTGSFSKFMSAARAKGRSNYSNGWIQFCPLPLLQFICPCCVSSSCPDNTNVTAEKIRSYRGLNGQRPHVVHNNRCIPSYDEECRWLRAYSMNLPEMVNP